MHGALLLVWHVRQWTGGDIECFPRSSSHRQVFDASRLALQLRSQLQPCPMPHAHARYKCPVHSKKARIGLIGSSPVYRCCSPEGTVTTLHRGINRVPRAPCTNWACMFIDFEASNSRIGSATHRHRTHPEGYLLCRYYVKSRSASTAASTVYG